MISGDGEGPVASVASSKRIGSVVWKPGWPFWRPPWPKFGGELPVVVGHGQRALEGLRGTPEVGEVRYRRQQEVDEGQQIGG